MASSTLKGLVANSGKLGYQLWHRPLKMASLVYEREIGDAVVDDDNRDLKQRRRRRQGQRLEKNEFIFYRQILQMPRSAQCLYRCQNLLKLNM